MYAVNELDFDEPCFETIQQPMNLKGSKGLELDAFDPQQFRRHAEIVIAKLEHYLNDTSVKGLALTDPAVLLEIATALTATGSKQQDVDEEKLKAIIDLYISTGIQVHSPGYMGRQFSGVVPLAGIFDFVSSIVNQPSSFYEAGQLPNVVERIMAAEFHQFIGWDAEQATMVTTSGGSLANLTALLAARNDKLPQVWSTGMTAFGNQPRPAVAMSEDVHYSLSRAVGILGIGAEQIVRLPLNEKGQICTAKVRPTLDAAAQQGLNVFCLVACAGTTTMGAFDSLDELADIAAERNLWLHVDGAHGASLLVSDKLRHKLQGLEKVDSFVLDAHKTLFVPAMCTLLFYKNKRKSYGAFQQEASYVFEKQPDIYTEFDSAEKNFECTKRPMIMNLWVLWVIYGKALFAEKLQYLCELTQKAYQILLNTPDFEVLHQPEANILCFRYTPTQLHEQNFPEFQVQIRNHLRKQGKFFISKVNINGEGALRVVFMNHEIEVEHFQMLLSEIRTVGQQLLINAEY